MSGAYEHELHVLVPGRDLTLAVCPMGQLAARLDDGESLEDAVTGAAIDHILPHDTEMLARVHQLNETGDAAAYWKPVPR